MDKKITLIVGIIVLIIVVVVVLYLTLFQKETIPEPEVSEAEAACVASGGTIVTSSCCISSGDFPNTCLIGACGCSAENSEDTKICACPEGSCFDGNSCVVFEEIIPEEDIPAEEDATVTEPEVE